MTYCSTRRLWSSFSFFNFVLRFRLLHTITSTQCLNGYKLTGNSSSERFLIHRINVQREYHSIAHTQTVENVVDGVVLCGYGGTTRRSNLLTTSPRNFGDGQSDRRVLQRSSSRRRRSQLTFSRLLSALSTGFSLLLLVLLLLLLLFRLREPISYSVELSR